MSNKIYRYYQPNDKDTKDNHSDCVIRALTKVLNKEWLATFDGLLPYARDMQCMPSERKCITGKRAKVKILNKNKKGER